MLIDDLRAFARVSQSSYAACEAMDKAAAQLEAMQAEIERLRGALRDLLTAVEAADSVKRGDFYHERKAARAALARASLDNSKEGEK